MACHRLLCALVALALSLPALAGGKTKIAVLELRVDRGLDPGIAKTLDEVMLNTFHEAGTLEVLGSSDIATMLTLEEERVKLTGCMDDSCLAEIGGALGVHLLASASVGAVGEQFILSVKVIDVNKARVVDRAGANVDRDESKLVEALTGLVRKVTATLEKETEADDGPAPGSSATVEKKGGAMRVLPWIGLGLTVALGGVGGACGVTDSCLSDGCNNAACSECEMGGGAGQRRLLHAQIRELQLREPAVLVDVRVRGRHESGLDVELPQGRDGPDAQVERPGRDLLRAAVGNPTPAARPRWAPRRDRSDTGAAGRPARRAPRRSGRTARRSTAGCAPSPDRPDPRRTGPAARPCRGSTRSCP